MMQYNTHNVGKLLEFNGIDHLGLGIHPNVSRFITIQSGNSRYITMASNSSQLLQCIGRLSVSRPFCGISYFLSRIELTHVLQPRVHPLHSTPIVSIVSCLSYLSSILASRVRSRSVRVCTVQTRIPSLPCAPSRPLDSPRALRRLAPAVFLTVH